MCDVRAHFQLLSTESANPVVVKFNITECRVAQSPRAGGAWVCVIEISLSVCKMSPYYGF